MSAKRQRYGKSPWYSSYEQNNYGDLLYSLIRIYRPKKVVELGTKAGYSAYHIARGLRVNGKGRLYCYDLWEKYEFRSVSKAVAKKNLKEFKDLINFRQRDAVGVDKVHKTIDILHVDISNDGEKLEKIIPKWIDKTSQLIIIEGGSIQRDKIDWMSEYKKIPIKKWLEALNRYRCDIEYFTIEPFPSLTIIRKK